MNLKTQFLQVAVGIIKDTKGNVLIAKRAKNAYQGGLWEFSGGKVEKNETVVNALKRELFEELGITVISANPLIKIQHHYEDLSVLLNVWEIDNFSGEAYGKEGQEIKWQSIKQLFESDFPAANKAIIKAIQLPHYYAILDDTDKTHLLTNFYKILDKGITLIQARLKNLSQDEVELFLEMAMPLCKKNHVKLLINSAVINADKIKVDGLHLTSRDLMALTKPLKINGLLAASCHNLLQLQHAEKMGIDFAVLAPVLATKTHPNAKNLGWETTSKLIEKVNIPVFALGGVSIKDKPQALALGMQGIAGIRTFLN